MKKKRKTIAFLERAILHKGNDCLLWPYARNSAGYAHMVFCGRHQLVHRMVLRSWKKPLAAGMVAGHLCGNGHLGCVNPQHLAWLTTKENLGQKIIHGTHNGGQNCHLAKLSAAQVEEILRIGKSMPQWRIGEMFGVTQSNVSYILRGKSWQAA